MSFIADSRPGQTNAQRLLLLPINLVRYVTDPIAESILRASRLASSSSFEAAPLDADVAKSGLITHIFRLVDGKIVHQAGFSKAHLADFQAKVSFALQQAKTVWLEMARNDTSRDRALCIMLGYFVAVATAIICLRHTSNVQARNATRAIRDAIKHQIFLAKVSMRSSIKQGEI